MKDPILSSVGISVSRDDTIATRASLLDRLRDCQDQASWQEFFDTYWRLIYTVATQAGLSDAEAQDVVQETVISVAKNVGEFRYDPKICSFKTWMLRMTRWRISPEQFQMFHLYAVKQLPVTQVARMVGVSIPSVYLAKHRVAAQLKREVQRLEAGMPGQTADQGSTRV